MLTIEDIENFVVANGFGIARSPWHENIILSAGIIYVMTQEPQRWRDYILGALKQVEARDYLGYYEPDETPIPGAEYFQCPSPLGEKDAEKINAHWEVGHLILYFPFER